MAIQHIIFDLDGTLMDTEKGNLYAWQKTLRYYVPWRTFSNTELKAILGVTTEKALTMLQVENVDAAQFDEYWQLQYQTQVEHIALFSGMLEVLENLRHQGYTLGIVTSRDWQEYRAYFSSPSFDALFACIICKEDTLLHKPDPEPLLAYMRKMNAVKEDCIYIGDMDTYRRHGHGYGMCCQSRCKLCTGSLGYRWSGIAGLSFFTATDICICTKRIDEVMRIRH